MDAYASAPEWEVWLAFTHGRASVAAQVLKNVRRALAREVHCFVCRIPMNPRRTRIVVTDGEIRVTPEAMTATCMRVRA